MVQRWRTLSTMVKDVLPLLLSYAATILGAKYIVESFSAVDAATYLIVSVVVPQVGLWADFGRVTAILVRVQGRPDAFRRELLTILVRLPIFVVPTVLLGVLIFVAVPLRDRGSAVDIVLLVLIAAATAACITFGNALRTVLLLDGRRTLYFWTQLCISAGIPVFTSISESVGVGLLSAGVMHTLVHVFAWNVRGRMKREHFRPRGSIRDFLQADRFSWGVGGTQLITAASVASELPILAAMSPSHLLVYYGLTRIAQGVATVGLRPIERALPDVVVAASGSFDQAAARLAWFGGVRRSTLICVAGAIGIWGLGPWAVQAWLGSQAVPDPVTLAFVSTTPLAIVAYRGAAAQVLADHSGRRLIAVAMTDLVVKLVLAIMLVPTLGAGGMAIAVLVSALCAGVAAGGLSLYSNVIGHWRPVGNESEENPR